MDRRATLNTLLGKSSKKQINSSTTSIVTGLEPYTGPWEYQQAAHLLRRTTFGPTNERIKTAVDDGLSATISQLMNTGPLPDPPVNYDYELDPFVAIGETWIDQPYDPVLSGQIRNRRRRSLKAWTAFLIFEEGTSIREKMTLFWHNHFVTANINDPKLRYDYINRLRSNVLGNFRDLTKQMTIDPTMLRYLNGNQNTKNAPNENYARELLELFTIGKGPQVGPGDYTSYTEDDVVAMARVLTGWRDLGNNDEEGNPITSEFVPSRHDTEDKQLSHRFDNIVVSNADENEYSNLIDIIFQKDEVAYFISRKLYRWFVFYEITPDIETNVIDPMAQLLIANDYEIATVVEALLNSQHFYDEAVIGCMIKNPWDFLLGLIKELEFNLPSDDIEDYYNLFRNIFDFTSTLQMEYHGAPSVAGWTAYYQEPAFYQLWINSVTLPFRTQLATIANELGVQLGGDTIQVDYLGLLDSMENPFEINPLIDEFVRRFLPKDIAQSQKDYFKEILIPGLPDFEWNVEYTEYSSDPTNPELSNPIKNKIKSLITAILIMPEYQLS